MASYNHVHLIGNLGGDPETKTVKTAKGDTTVATFRIATNETWKSNGQEQTRTDWHTVEVWGVQAKSVGEYLSKGREVTVVGKLRVDTWEKDGQKHSRVKVVADRVIFHGGAKADEVAGDASDAA